jgi:hypothetical protein
VSLLAAALVPVSQVQISAKCHRPSLYNTKTSVLNLGMVRHNWAVFSLCFTKHFLPACPSFRKKNDAKLYVQAEENTHVPLLESLLLIQPWWSQDSSGAEPHNLPKPQTCLIYNMNTICLSLKVMWRSNGMFTLYQVSLINVTYYF